MDVFASKRLLHVVDSFAPEAGGTTESILRLAQSGVGEAEVVSLDDPGAAYVQGHGFAVHALGPAKGQYRFTPRLYPWLMQHLARFDGVVIHGLWQHHSYGTYRAVLGRTPYVVFPHGMLDPYFKRAFPFKHVKKQAYWLARERRVLRDARAVCFTTAAERDAAVGTFWPRQWTPAVVSLGICAPPGNVAEQQEMFLTRYPLLRERRFLLFLSRIHRKKGCDLLLQAFAQVAQECPLVDLVMAGPDEEELRPELEALGQRLGIETRVHWTGMLEGGWKWGAFYSAMAFVLPSHQENFGIAVVEAMACGVPVVISDKVNIWPEVASEGAGIVKPDTVAGTLEGLLTLLSLSAEERLRMGANGVACFGARYEMGRAVEELVGLF